MRIQPYFAGVHFTDTLDQQIRGALLQNDSGRSQLHGLHEFVLVLGRCKNDDARALVGLLERLQGTEPIQVGHAKIEQENVRVQLLDLVQNLASVGGFSHHLHVLFQAEELI